MLVVHRLGINRLCSATFEELRACHRPTLVSRKYLSVISYVELKEYIDYNKLF